MVGTATELAPRVTLRRCGRIRCGGRRRARARSPRFGGRARGDAPGARSSAATPSGGAGLVCLSAARRATLLATPSADGYAHDIVLQGDHENVCSDLLPGQQVTAVAVSHRVQGRPDAPTVVLSGSLGSTMAMWDPQVPALGEQFRTVRYDARGHGASPVPPGPYSVDDLVDDLVALLDTVGVERAHVVGLSLGGMVAMRLAAREPARVDRLVLLCTSAVLTPPQAWAERAALVRAQGTGAVADAVVARWLTDARRRSRPDQVQQLVAMVAATPAQGYASCCTAIERMDLREDLPRIGAPTLVVAGAEDPSMPLAHQEAIVAAVPGARLAIVEHAAHLASFEQPDAVNALLLDHLTRTIDL